MEASLVVASSFGCDLWYCNSPNFFRRAPWALHRYDGFIHVTRSDARRSSHCHVSGARRAQILGVLLLGGGRRKCPVCGGYAGPFDRRHYLLHSRGSLIFVAWRNRRVVGGSAMSPKEMAARIPLRDCSSSTRSRWLGTKPAT